MIKKRRNRKEKTQNPDLVLRERCKGKAGVLLGDKSGLSELAARCLKGVSDLTVALLIR